MAVTFHKMHGLGNDFVLLDLRQQDFPVNKNKVIQLANRNTGVGFDQLLVLRNPSSSQHLASFEVWNADGSRAEQCGNGVRCLGLYLHMRSETPAGQFLLGGLAGSVKIECLGDGGIQVDMGQPDFAAERIPVLMQAGDGWYTLEIDQKQYRLGAVSMGNPHALIMVDDIDTADVARLGAKISRHSAFPKGCNAGFAQVVDRDNILLRVYERGAGETRACGSGACAAMVVLHKAGLVNQSVNVAQTGGDLKISWTGAKKTVIMVGPATHVFEGMLT